MPDTNITKKPYTGRKRGPKSFRPRRITLRLTVDTYNAIFALAAEVGKPAASVVAEHLEMNRPVFEALKETVIASKSGDFKQVSDNIDKFRGGIGAAMQLITQGFINFQKKKRQELENQELEKAGKL